MNTSLIMQKTNIINNILYKNFQIFNLKHKLVFSACLLWFVKENTNIDVWQIDNLNDLKMKIIAYLNQLITNNTFNNSYLNFLVTMLNKIDVGQITNSIALNKIIACIKAINKEISDNILFGEDVLALFFNEFNHYNDTGTELGQVLTPDYVTDLMYHLSDITPNSIILDATCGSGSFLVKAWHNETQQYQNPEFATHLFGIEKDEAMFALAIVNTLITNATNIHLLHQDVLTNQASNFIKTNNINRVLMNPPYENEFKPIEIMTTVLDNCTTDAICSFLMPNTLLKTRMNQEERINLFAKHSLLKIIKLPKDVFGNVGCGQVSIFMFKAHHPQTSRTVGYYIKNDGLVNIKNKGRLDLYETWKKDKRNYWIKVINETDKTEPSYKLIDPIIEPYYKDEISLVVNPYTFFQFLIQNKAKTKMEACGFNINLLDDKSINNLDTSTWSSFTFGTFFTLRNGQRIIKHKDYKLVRDKINFIPVITASTTGIAGYYHTSNCDAGAIIIGGQASGMHCMYVDYPCFVLDGRRIAEIKPEYKDDFNENLAWFFCYLLNQYQSIYDYSIAANVDDINNTKIILPIDKKGEVDWTWLNKFVTDINTLSTNFLTKIQTEFVIIKQELKKGE